MLDSLNIRSTIGVEFYYHVKLIVIFMSLKKIFFNGVVKQVLSQVWQTVLLTVIACFAYGSVYVALNLQHYCNECTVKTTVFLFCTYAIFVHFVADFIWEYVLPKIKSNYWCEWLASSIFFMFVVCGLLALVIFLYESYVYWFAAAFTMRVFPLILGIFLFCSFCYKVVQD